MGPRLLGWPGRAAELKKSGKPDQLTGQGLRSAVRETWPDGEGEVSREDSQSRGDGLERRAQGRSGREREVLSDTCHPTPKTRENWGEIRNIVPVPL